MFIHKSGYSWPLQGIKFTMVAEMNTLIAELMFSSPFKISRDQHSSQFIPFSLHDFLFISTLTLTAGADGVHNG